MLTAIFIYLAIVLIHGAYRAGRRGGVRYALTFRRQILKAECAPPCVDIREKMAMSNSEMQTLHYDSLAAMQERTIRILVDHVLEEARKHITTERMQDDYLGTTVFSARLRVIPPKGARGSADDSLATREGWLRAYDALRMRAGTTQADLDSFLFLHPR